MKKTKIGRSKIIVLALFAISITLVSCSTTEDATPQSEVSTSGTITEVVKSTYKSMVTVSTSSTSMTLKSQGIPDHTTAYWGVENSLSKHR